MSDETAGAADRDAEIEREVRQFLKDLAPLLVEAIDKLERTSRVWEVMDSLSLLDLLEKLEKRFSIVIAPVDVIPDNFQSIEKMVRFIGQRTSAPS